MTEQPLDNLGRQFSSTPILGIDAPRGKVGAERMQRVLSTVFFACCQAPAFMTGLRPRSYGAMTDAEFAKEKARHGL